MTTLFLPINTLAKTTYPNPIGLYMNDYTNSVSQETTNHVNRLGEELNQKTDAQIVVAIIESLDGESIEDYALRLARQWDIGDEDKKNGILMLRAVADKQIYIAVADGLGGALPDGKVGRILDEKFLPYSTQGDLDSAVTETYDTLAAAVAAEYNVELTGTDVQDMEPYHYEEEGDGSLDTLFILLLVVGFPGLWFLVGIARRRNGRGPRGGPPWMGGGSDDDFGGFGGGFGGGSGGGFSGGGGGGGFSGGGAGRSG